MQITLSLLDFAFLGLAASCFELVRCFLGWGRLSDVASFLSVNKHYCLLFFRNLITTISKSENLYRARFVKQPVGDKRGCTAF